jgi:dienelactone hydrolase
MRTWPFVAFVALALAACTTGPESDAASQAGDLSATDQTARKPSPNPSAPTTGTSSPPAGRPGLDAFPGSKIFMPATTPAPGILMLHGSEGGSDDAIDGFAQSIAQKGFVVVKMCWFGCDGRPAKILRVPLESVVDLGNWLATSPDVAGGNVGLFGWSRGAELSLLVTSLVGTKPFRAVAVHAPSDTIVSAFDPATEDDAPDFGGILEPSKSTGQMVPAPSWTWQGQDLFGEPKADFSVPGPKIDVTKYLNPVYVSQGEQDEVWDVSRGHAVVDAREAKNLPTQSHFYPGEGHVLMQPADVQAMNDEVSAFFQQNLARSGN